ncbi:unnamed protein product [Sphacelaria rigidula]
MRLGGPGKEAIRGLGGADAIWMTAFEQPTSLVRHTSYGGEGCVSPISKRDVFRRVCNALQLCADCWWWVYA